MQEVVPIVDEQLLEVVSLVAKSSTLTKARLVLARTLTP